MILEIYGPVEKIEKEELKKALRRIERQRMKRTGAGIKYTIKNSRQKRLPGAKPL